MAGKNDTTDTRRRYAEGEFNQFAGPPLKAIAFLHAAHNGGSLADMLSSQLVRDYMQWLNEMPEDERLYTLIQGAAENDIAASKRRISDFWFSLYSTGGKFGDQEIPRNPFVFVLKVSTEHYRTLTKTRAHPSGSWIPIFASDREGVPETPRDAALRILRTYAGNRDEDVSTQVPAQIANFASMRLITQEEAEHLTRQFWAEEELAYP